jgi:hypothetical protein
MTSSLTVHSLGRLANVHITVNTCLQLGVFNSCVPAGYYRVDSLDLAVTPRLDGTVDTPDIRLHPGSMRTGTWDEHPCSCILLLDT